MTEHSREVLEIYNIFMDYFDELPEESRVELDKRLRLLDL